MISSVYIAVLFTAMIAVVAPKPHPVHCTSDKDCLAYAPLYSKSSRSFSICSILVERKGSSTPAAKTNSTEKNETLTEANENPSHRTEVEEYGVCLEFF
ncbi:unnamed protein product [Caenorhabditis auriculariae]|uniref:Secreted protein n=1 Tax=Caenorhabditis auriculariae TaxID=2777116 RepID=A0A8S1GZG4_9PELO|nr:unnamed protein product [Caenorhabditis auriculariae]